MAALKSFHGHVEDSKMVGHEEGIELGFFELLYEGDQMFEVEVGVRICAGISPCACMSETGRMKAVRWSCFGCAILVDSRGGRWGDGCRRKVGDVDELVMYIRKSQRN